MKPKNFDHRPLIIRSHYGDESIALVQWAYEAGLKQIEVVTIDTGWAAKAWASRQQKGEAHAMACGFKTSTIVSKITFTEAVKGRGEFPSAKFQWCSALLKGLPFLDWLDTWDPGCQAIILLAKRKEAADAHAKLPEWIEKCEFHNDRTVWHPLLNLGTLERDALLQGAGFSPLHHRSLECDPCVNSTLSDLGRLSAFDIRKTKDLEKALASNFFSEPSTFPELTHYPLTLANGDKEYSMSITELIQLAKVYGQDSSNNATQHYLDLFYRGCGNHFGCGL